MKSFVFFDVTCRSLSSLNAEATCSSETSVDFQRTAWPESASELYRPNGRRLSVKLVPSFADRGCHVVSVTDPYGRNLGFLDRVKS
jgi:hypothetical protein